MSRVQKRVLRIFRVEVEGREAQMWVVRTKSPRAEIRGSMGWKMVERQALRPASGVAPASGLPPWCHQPSYSPNA